jgi:hypothetical protein
MDKVVDLFIKIKLVKMKNEIRNIEELKNKTISDFRLDCGDLWLKFSDNTFVVLVVNDITEGYGHTKNEVNISNWSKDKTDPTLFELGLISENEYKQALREEEIEEEKRQQEYDNKEKERIKNYELEQLERLKSKYGL